MNEDTIKTLIRVTVLDELRKFTEWMTAGGNDNPIEPKDIELYLKECNLEREDVEEIPVLSRETNAPIGYVRVRVRTLFYYAQAFDWTVTVNRHGVTIESNAAGMLLENWKPEPRKSNDDG